MGLGAGEGAINIFYEAFTHGALFPTTPLPAPAPPRDLRGKVLLTSTETGPWGSARSLQILRYSVTALVVTFVGRTPCEDSLMWLSERTYI